MNKPFSTSPPTTMSSSSSSSSYVHNRPLTLYPSHPTHRRGYPLSFEPLSDQQSEDWKKGCTHYQDNISYGFLCYRYKKNNENSNDNNNNSNKKNKNNNNNNKKQIEFLLCQSQSTKNWGLIKGTFESNEDELGYVTAEREFYEETGMTIDKSHILYIDYTTFYEMFHVKNKNKVDHQLKVQQKLKYQQQQQQQQQEQQEQEQEQEQQPSIMEASKSLSSLSSSSSSSLSSLLSSSEQINQHVQNNTKGPIHAWIKRKYNIIFICHLRENTPNTLNPPVVQTGELLCTKWVTYDYLKQHLFTRTFLPYRQCIEHLMRVHQIPLEIDAHITDWMYLQQRFGQVLDLTPFRPHSRKRHKRNRTKNNHNPNKPQSQQQPQQKQKQKQKPKPKQQPQQPHQKKPPAKKEKKSTKEKSTKNREKR